MFKIIGLVVVVLVIAAAVYYFGFTKKVKSMIEMEITFLMK